MILGQRDSKADFKETAVKVYLIVNVNMTCIAVEFALVLAVASMSEAAVVPVFVPLILNLPDQPEVASPHYWQAEDVATNGLESDPQPLYYDYGSSM